MNTFRFECYVEDLVSRVIDGITRMVKQGFTTIPLADKWENLPTADKAKIIHGTDRISQRDVEPDDAQATLDKMDAFASMFGLKGHAQYNKKTKFAWCNKRPDSNVSFDAVLEHDDELLQMLADMPR